MGAVKVISLSLMEGRALIFRSNSKRNMYDMYIDTYACMCSAWVLARARSPDFYLVFAEKSEHYR